MCYSLLHPLEAPRPVKFILKDSKKPETLPADTKDVNKKSAINYDMELLHVNVPKHSKENENCLAVVQNCSTQEFHICTIGREHGETEFFAVDDILMCVCMTSIYTCDGMGNTSSSQWNHSARVASSSSGVYLKVLDDKKQNRVSVFRSVIYIIDSSAKCGNIVTCEQERFSQNNGDIAYYSVLETKHLENVLDVKDVNFVPHVYKSETDDFIVLQEDGSLLLRKGA